MNVQEAMMAIQYDTNWEVWTVPNPTPDSPARYGQRQFEQGGMLDEMTLCLGNGVQITDEIRGYLYEDHRAYQEIEEEYPGGTEAYEQDFAREAVQYALDAIAEADADDQVWRIAGR